VAEPGTKVEKPRRNPKEGVEGFCQVKIGSFWDGGVHVCGRRVAGEGLCGMHLRWEKYRRDRSAKWDALWERGRALGREAEELSKALGTPISADFYGVIGTGKFIVTREFLRGLVDKKTRGQG